MISPSEKNATFASHDDNDYTLITHTRVCTSCKQTSQLLVHIHSCLLLTYCMHSRFKNMTGG